MNSLDGRNPCSWFVGGGDRSVPFIEQHQNTNQSSSRKLFAAWGLRRTKRKFFSRRVSVVHIWRQWSSFQDDLERWHTCQEPTELRLIVFWQNQFGRQDPSRIFWHQTPTRWFVDQRKFHTWWVRSSLSFVDSRFSSFSCSHVLSNWKQSAMSRRAQESISKEVSAVAKPRPMNLVSRNIPSAKSNLPQGSGDSNSPGNEELDESYDSSSVRKLTRYINPTVYSQEMQQDDTQSSSTRILGGRDELSSSYGETCSGEIDCRIESYTILQFNKKITHASQQSKSWLINSKRIHIERRWKPTWRKIHAYNPFSEKSQDTIRSMGNVEYFEMSEITP